MATEDYMKMPLLFKLRKVLRYVKLYGISRTLIKVKGQLHMASTDGFDGVRWDNDKCKNPDADSRNVGLIGCGSFSFGNLAYYVSKADSRAIAGAMDPNPARAKSLISKYNGGYATTDADLIINDPKVSLVYIASNHASHAPYAVKALDAGKHVHIEKPHIVSQEQLDELVAAMKRNPDGKVFIGFNRPRSKLFEKLQSELAKESGPLMVNWFVAGHAIDDDHWYFKESEGGRILGNLCHWSDLTLQLVGMENAFPIRVVPTSAKGAKSDFVSSLEFADGSLATISFSAKGHTFEGVREILNLHKGNVLAKLEDFKTLTVERGASVKKTSGFYRDHGHDANVLNSFNGVRNEDENAPVSVEYMRKSAEIFLAIKIAHDTGKEVHIPK